MLNILLLHRQFLSSHWCVPVRQTLSNHAWGAVAQPLLRSCALLGLGFSGVIERMYSLAIMTATACPDEPAHFGQQVVS